MSKAVNTETKFKLLQILHLYYVRRIESSLDKIKKDTSESLGFSVF